MQQLKERYSATEGCACAGSPNQRGPQSGWAKMWLMIMESRIVRIKNNTDCRRVEYLHRAYTVLSDPEKEAKRESQPTEGGQRGGSLTFSSTSLSVSTRTSRDESTLRISRPSSASSRLSNRCSFCS